MDAATRRQVTSIDYELAARLKRRNTATRKIAELLLVVAEIDDEADTLLDARTALLDDNR